MGRFKPPRYVLQRGPWQQRSAQTYEVLRPSFYTAFFTYYLAIVAYGLTAGLLGVFALEQTTLNTYAESWGYAVAAAGTTAGAGMYLSRRWQRPWVEVIATCLLLGLLAGYGLAVVAYGFQTHAPTRVAGAWLPVIVGIFPTMRVLWIANDGLLRRPRRAD